ncbi:uracil-xanthine permease family protein [Legionella clemsonensis]|uniref:Xanthine permease XanQ n=1 Tax=Legionella clemsonensis TaxID=1867846 RepID=A0A222P1F6_9GAMM|nr:solute carrier family 23 protein [Legionella clemsonensis]ASQ45605.1 Xanthine permease XanQ [Legionella clemsonensis]
MADSIDNNDLVYTVDDKPPFIKLLLLGLQYVLLMSVYLVLVIIVVRAAHLPDDVAFDAVRMGMIALGIATSLQALRPPYGSGYLAPPVVSAIYLKASLLAADAGGLPLVLGMTIFSGLVEVVFSRLVYQLRAMFPPGISGFIIVIVGIELGLEGLSQFLGVARSDVVNFERHLFIGLLTLGTMITISIWWRGIVKLICSFIGLVVGFTAAYFLGSIDATKIAQLQATPFFAFPHINFISYNFSFSLVLPFFIASVAAALRTVGVVTTCQKINSSSWKSPSLKSIKGGIFADGLAAITAGLCGIPGISTGPSLVGVSKATGATSRYIAFSTSIFLVLLAFLPKFASLLLIMPIAVIAPALMFTGSFMIIGGISVMTSRNIDTRMTYVIGLALLFGLSKEVYPTFYSSLPTFLQTMTSTTLSLSVIVALLLHLLFRIGIRKQAMLTLDNGKELTRGKLTQFIIENANYWQINIALMERIAQTTNAILQHLYNSQLAEDNINLLLTYDQIDVVVKITYDGDLLLLPFVNQKKTVFLEEEAFSYGLSDFLIGVYPDKFEHFTTGKTTHLHLYFNV